MTIALLAFGIELAIGAALWFIWAPLAFFLALVAIGGLARHLSSYLTNASWKGGLVVASYYVIVALLIALVVYYGAILSGNGLAIKIALGFWGLIAALYAHTKRPGHFIGAAPAYTFFTLLAFLVW